MHWDLNGVIGTGQSLSVGELPIVSVTQPYENLMLSLGGARVPPWNPDYPELALVPLVEPLRPLAEGWPSPYPANLYGETLHAAMAHQVSSLAKAKEPDADHVTVHSVVGESGQGMVALAKHSGDTTGITGRAYAATLFETAAIARLARDAKKSFGVRALVITHGETDAMSPTYERELVELAGDVNRDVRALTGQSDRIVVLLSQQFAFPSGAGERSVATQAQWRLGVERPDEFVCTGPKYQYTGSGDGVHLLVTGTHRLGEKTGQVYFERFVLGRDWQPLHPLGAARTGRSITVRFHVPVPPLAWDETLAEPLAWPKGRGFEVFASTEKIEIASVSLGGDSATIVCAGDLPDGVRIGYAAASAGIRMWNASRAYRWGLLRDSDPFVGSTTRTPQPNFCVSFEMPVTS
jgi:hypothetical protein